MFLGLYQYLLSFVKGLYQQSCRCSLLVPCFSYIPATMKNARQGDFFPCQRRSVQFSDLSFFPLYIHWSLWILFVIILIVTFLLVHNFAYNAGIFLLSSSHSFRSGSAVVINIYLDVLQDCWTFWTGIQTLPLSSVPFDRGHSYRNSPSRYKSSLHEIAWTLGSHGNQPRLASLSESNFVVHLNVLHEGCVGYNILRRICTVLFFEKWVW